MSIFQTQDFIYNAFPIADNKSSIERYILNGRIPRRYLRKPHLVLTQHGPESPNGVDKYTRGFVPYIYVDQETFEARFEQVVFEDDSNKDYIYRLKQL